VCVDEVEFMASVLEPATLLGRIETWLGDEIRAGTLHPRSSAPLFTYWNIRGCRIAVFSSGH